MTSSELIEALLLGVLLPASFLRPRFLEQHPMSEYARRRWVFVYSTGAFAAMGYVYGSAVYVLRPAHSFSASGRHVLYGAALILLAIAGLHHIPPLLSAGRSRGARIIGALTAPTIGFVIGAFLAVDEVFSKVRQPWLSTATWFVLLLLGFLAAVWFSGLSPQTQLLLFRWRRARRLRRRPT